MSTLVIPTFANNPLHRYSVRLGQRDYILAWDWVGRLGRWYLSLYTAEGTLLQGGCKVVPNWPLFARNPDARFPGGVLMYVANNGEAPTLTDLGINGSLMWSNEV